ncbi:hypothetical protein [Clostridium sp. UBA1056]|uniref:hypothetical protein n=1 Tax=unclassified Clostridium TaxID=2614128 RepID=UPI0032175D39
MLQLYGKYTDSINTLGVAGDFVIGFFNIDLPADIRDLSHDFKYWQWSWGHAAETTLYAIGIVPVIGVIKYGDEVGGIVKDAEKGAEAIKLKGGIKGAAEAIGDLSSKALKHLMNDHMVSRYAKQVVEGSLSKKSFFNPSWTEEQVTNALNSAYKDAVIDGYHTYKIYGEEINIFMGEGKFSTGFGNHKFTYNEIINFGK